tara:strand:- start:3128 stop:3784 length:657 start_codon:yes stop_codon:yes gene_type:complete
MKRKYNWMNHFFNFLAVILGVYLAFYLSERSKINQERKESMILMNSLVNDLSDDIKTYESYQIPINSELRENVEDLLNLLIADSLYDIDSKLSLILEVENFAPTTSTYSSMKSSGKLSLIDDLALQKALSNYYEGLVFESQKKGEYQVAYFTSEILNWLTTNFDLMDVKIVQKDDVIILRNKLLIYESLIAQKVNSYETIVEDSKKLKSQIESLQNDY